MTGDKRVFARIHAFNTLLAEWHRIEANDGAPGRALAIPAVRDRVAQGAAALVITPVLDLEFESASFGFRRHRSVPHAVAQILSCCNPCGCG